MQKGSTCEVRAWYEPGAWEGIGRYKPRTCEVHGRCMRGTCEIKARSKPDQSPGSRCYLLHSQDSLSPSAFRSRGFWGVAEVVRSFRTSSATRSAIRPLCSCLPVGLPAREAGRGQRNGLLDLVRISNRTTTRSRQANSSHEVQPGAFVPEDAGLGVKPTGSPIGGCAWAKPVGTAQLTTGPSAGPNPSSSARAVKATSPWRLAGTRHECAQLPPQPNSKWPRPTTSSPCRIVSCGGAFSS